MFFDGWFDLLRIVVVGVCAYVGLIILLRLSGKRTLSKLNAFDLVVTVALGSTLSSALLSKDVSLAEGLLAFAVLCGLQYLVAVLALRWKRIEKLVKAEPTLLFFRGEFLPEALREERIARDEVLAAIRQAGEPSPTEVAAVVLETDGSLAVVGRTGVQHLDSLAGVGNWKAVKER